MTTPPLTHAVEGLMALVKSFGDISQDYAMGRISPATRHKALEDIQSYAVWLVDATAVDAAAEALKAPSAEPFAWARADWTDAGDASETDVCYRKQATRPEGRGWIPLYDHPAVSAMLDPNSDDAQGLAAPEGWWKGFHRGYADALSLVKFAAKMDGMEDGMFLDTIAALAADPSENLIDAQRWRRIRDETITNKADTIAMWESLTGEELDAAIDAAIKSGKANK